MLQIAVNTPIVPGPDDLDYCLPVLAEAGFDGIDASLIRVWSKKAPEACPTEEVFLEKALTIAEKIRKNGLSVLQTHGPILMKTADDLKESAGKGTIAGGKVLTGDEDEDELRAWAKSLL